MERTEGLEMRDPTNGSASRRPRKPIMSAGSCGGLGRARHSAFPARSTPRSGLRPPPDELGDDGARWGS